MNHQSSKVKVYVTSDYKVFRFVDGNRKTTPAKKARIIKEINAGNDNLQYYPILVTENGKYLDIQDGQNRFEICKTLERPVHYVVKEGKMNMYEVAKLNSNVERWNGKNFIDFYSAKGNENYTQLGKFMKKYGIALGLSVQMLTYGAGKHDGSNETLNHEFETGNFVIKAAKEARILAETCKNFEAFSGWNGRGFVIAITKILQAGICDMDILKKKFDRDPRKLMTQSNAKGYLANLQLIYNIDNMKQKPVY